MAAVLTKEESLSMRLPLLETSCTNDTLTPKIRELCSQNEHRTVRYLLLNQASTVIHRTMRQTNVHILHWCTSKCSPRKSSLVRTEAHISGQFTCTVRIMHSIYSVPFILPLPYQVAILRYDISHISQQKPSFNQIQRDSLRVQVIRIGTTSSQNKPKHSLA